jgi:hypothetical protein
VLRQALPAVPARRRPLGRLSLCCLALLVLGAACATRTAEQKAAERLAGQISHMQTNLASLAESRVNIARARGNVSQRLLRSALETEVINAENRDNLLNADQRTKLDNAIKKADISVQRRAKADAELAAAEALVQADASRVNPRSEELGATAKLLSHLAEKQSWREQAKFYFHFFNEVKASLDEMTATARADGSAAQDLTDAQQPPKTPKAEKEKP